MLRVGLTGGLGSGKSTVAAMFARGGVQVLEADSIGREMMQPGESVYRQIIAHFSQYPDAPDLVLADGSIDRVALAKYVFSTNRLAELNRIVHPAVIAEQERRMDMIFRDNPNAIVMVESALIFEADQGGTAPGWRNRFDKLILVTAPEEVRLKRFLDRFAESRTLSPQEQTTLEKDGRNRIARQIKDEEKMAFCDYVIENTKPMDVLENRVAEILNALHAESANHR